MEEAIAIKKKKSKKIRRIFSLLFIIAITLVVLIVSTYAWFVGVGEVKTSAFTINVGTAASLQLSLDGVNWFGSEDEFTITRDGVLGVQEDEELPNAYSGHTNHWIDAVNKGLNPVSSSGAVDPNVGRLVLYGKSSLTATKGGYRLISNRIDNYSITNDVLKDEDDSYIVFDMFVKNGNETIYNPVYNALDDEAIYLTTDSSVIVTPDGAEIEDNGLANSVRVAFVQVGRVMAIGSEVSDITSIDCTTDTIPSGTTNYAGFNTGLCSLSAVIWEPNDSLHNDNLISFFAGVCKTKSVSNSTITYSNNACTPLVNGTAVTTYTINAPIVNEDNVDIYDGINGFTIPNDYKLVSFDTLTDTEKVIEGHDRPTFFSLAANSITKLRVYIYLEGQDVDNYDLISNGNTITVNFGFTKDIFDLIESE